MGECPDGLTIERIDNDKGYCKENCKWATMAEQSKNKRIQKDCKLVTCWGETKPVAHWFRDPRVVSLNMAMQTLYSRLQRGMSPEMAFSRTKGLGQMQMPTMENRQTH